MRSRRKTSVIVAVLVAGTALGIVAALAMGGDGPPATLPDLANGLQPIEPAEAPVGPCDHQLSTTLPATRFAGKNPAGSAACAAFRSFTTGADRAVVATGTFEALVAAPLAERMSAPVLLVEPDALPGETVTALRDLGVEDITLVGSASGRLHAALAEVTSVTEVLAAESITELSLQVAKRTSDGPWLYVAPPEPAHVLVAATAAVRDGSSVIVVGDVPNSDALSLAEEVGAVRAVGHPTGVGGGADLSEQTIAPFRSVASVERVDGPDVAGTAAGITRLQTAADGPVHLVDVAAVDHAVSAAWLAPEERGPLLLVAEEGLPTETRRWLHLGGLRPDRPVHLLTPEAPDVLVSGLVDLAAAVAEGPPAPQVRGAWAHLFDDSLKTRQGITTFLDHAVETGLNTVFVQVARRQDAYYTSTILPRTTDPALDPQLDLLEELVPRAHARGLEVHAWFAVAQAWHSVYEDLPVPAGWVWSEHGPDSDDPWVTRPHPDAAQRLGYPDAYRDYPYLDMGVPAVQDHIVATLLEVATRYDIDAVHLDYIRYPGAEWGYHPVALQRFAAETGASIDPPPATDDPAWSAWRRSQVDALVARVGREVKAPRPDIEISAAVIAQGDGPTSSRPFSATIAYADKMQDWAGWAEQGLVDLTIPMAYFDERRYAERYDQWVGLARQLGESGARVAIGQGSWLNPSALSMSQATDALEHTAGLVLYSYQQDTWCPAGQTETGDPCEPVEPPTTLWQQLAEGPFSQPAPAR